MPWFAPLAWQICNMKPLEHGAPAHTLTAERALRNAGIYGVTAGLRGGVGFLLLPLYTRALTPSEYGRLAIILVITSAATIVFSFGLDFALFRGFFQLASQPAKQLRLVDSLWTFVIVASLAAALSLSLAIAPWLPPGAIVSPGELTISLLAAALLVSATTIPLSLMRAQQRLRDYVVLSALYAGATAVSTLLLVVVLDYGVRGWVVAMLITNLATFLAAVRLVPWRFPRLFERPALREGLLLGLPLIPHFLGHWALTLADRAVLAGLVSTATVGIYTLGATLALPALILVQAIGQAFMPNYAAAAVDDGARLRLSGIVSVQAVCVLMICLAVALLGPNLVAVVSPPEYHDAAPLVPWIALGYAFLGLYSIPMNALSLGMGRTKFVWIATAVAAATNIGLIYLLVPAHGLLAAAIASAVGYLVLLLAVSWHSRSPRNPVRCEWSRLLRAAGVVASVYAAAILTTDDTGLVGAIGRAAWLGVAGVGLVMSGSVRADRIRALLARTQTTT